MWDSECEALIWSEDGSPLQAFLGSGGEDRRAEYIITDSAKGGNTLNFMILLTSFTGEQYHFYVEMACTAMFGNGTGNGWGGLGPTPTDLNKQFTLKKVEIAAFDRLAYELLSDFVVLEDIAKVIQNLQRITNI